MSYYLRIIERIKKEVENNQYPPVFKKKFFDFNCKNCYAYALNLSVNDMRKKIFFPGCISDENEDPDIYSKNSLIERLKRDLDFLGFSYRENDKTLYDGEFRIAIYAFPSLHDCPIGFHISRQDKDGYWSEKPNWKKQPLKINYCGINPPDISEYTFFKTVLILKKK